MVLGPQAQVLSFLVPTKFLFLPYSQTQSSEIPIFLAVIAESRDELGGVGELW